MSGTLFLILNSEKFALKLGMRPQILVNKGTEWSLILFVQDFLSQYCINTRKPAYLQTSSKQVVIKK